MVKSVSMQGWLLGMMALLIMLMPSGVQAEMVLVSDEELAQIVGQFATFEIVNRNVLIDDNLGTSNDEYYNYDAVVIKLDIKLSLRADVRALMIGHYTDSDNDTGWDIDLQNMKFGTSTDNSATQGPVVFNGLRIELAFQDPGYATSNDPDFTYDHMASTNRRFLFFKFGTDHLTGNFQGDFNTVSADIDTDLSNVNAHRTGLGSILDGINFDDNGFWLAISQTGFDTCPDPIAYTTDAVPGNGIWMHADGAELDAYLL